MSEAKIADLEKRLIYSEWQTAEWTAQANQLTVANNQKANRIIELESDPSPDELRKFNGWDVYAALREFVRDRRAKEQKS